MLKMIVSGCNGHMGQCVVCGCAELEGVEMSRLFVPTKGTAL